MTRFMNPYFTFSSDMKSYYFIPGYEIFDSYPRWEKELNATTFYDIFDGYYHVILSFNVTIKRPKGLDPKFLAFLYKENNNTAPCFMFRYNGEEIPYAYVPKQFFNAGLKV